MPVPTMRARYFCVYAWYYKNLTSGIRVDISRGKPLDYTPMGFSKDNPRNKLNLTQIWNQPLTNIFINNNISYSTNKFIDNIPLVINKEFHHTKPKRYNLFG